MYALLLFILFPILYKKSRTWYFIYALLFFVIGRFVAYKLGLSYAIIIHTVFYFGVLLPFIIDKVYKKYFMPVILWLLVYVAYLFFLHVSHGNDFIKDLKFNSTVFFVFIFSVQVYENIINNKIDIVYYIKVFKVVLVFEIILCWMQYFSHDFGNFFKITEYTWNGEEMSMTGTSDEILDNNLCYGTLMRGSGFANYLTVNILVLFLAMSKRKIKQSDYLFLGFSVLTLLITGIRAPFLVLLIMLFFIFMRGKKMSYRIKYIAGGLLLFVFFLPILSNIGSKGGLTSYDNTVMRSLNVFTQLETGSITEESTLTYPLSMIPYIIQNPLFGNGLHYKSGYLMALNLHVLEEVSLADAGIFFYWAEYGLVGLLVFYFFYYYLMKISPHYGLDKSDISFLVVMLFMLSIVDISILDHNCTTVFAISPIIIQYYQRLRPATKNVNNINYKLV